MYSSIEEHQRLQVIERCYWPLLDLTERYNIKLGIEASGITLEIIQDLDPHWIAKLKQLQNRGLCEFIGCGYAQIIGPLVPSLVNAKNLSFGQQIYQEKLGNRPQISLINEQAYSAGLIPHYLNVGDRAIIMEWNNPFRHHPEWQPEWRYLPQLACTHQGDEIPLIWNKSIAFQKFQRYAHGEIELDEHLHYLETHLATQPRAFPLYGNDAEIFGYRPGRYHTEAEIEFDEWQRIEELFSTLTADDRFEFISPSQVLNLMQVLNAGNRLYLESAEQPIPVKKQGKYNITRWSVTGRNDLGINTACWRIFDRLKQNPDTSDRQWRELCYLWSSDFRTHITETRWSNYQKCLKTLAKEVGILEPVPPIFASISGDRDFSETLPDDIQVEREKRYLNIVTPGARICLNCRRGLAIERFGVDRTGEDWLVGTLHHGYYDDIQWGADYYTGHLVFETPGQPKVADLNPVEPIVRYDRQRELLQIEGIVATPLGNVRKRICIPREKPRISIAYQLDWGEQPIGALRLGHITLNPKAFQSSQLFYRNHQGGDLPETFFPNDRPIDHSRSVSFLVSAESGIGLTQGWIEVGDRQRWLRIGIDRQYSMLLGMFQYQRIDPDYFCRLLFSAREMDETSRIDPMRSSYPLSCAISIEVRS
ncbi:MAG: glycoside hydrolase family 57 [Cyanobacteriota bacterium]|nr:glycoside hydrolase family 57 [Cyanobacteriota bacterium]